MKTKYFFLIINHKSYHVRNFQHYPTPIVVLIFLRLKNPGPLSGSCSSDSRSVTNHIPYSCFAVLPYKMRGLDSGICKLPPGSKFYDSHLSSSASGQPCHLNRALLISSQRNLKYLNFVIQTKATVADKLEALIWKNRSKRQDESRSSSHGATCSSSLSQL